MNTSERLELEIELLQKKRQALASDLKFKQHQYDLDMPCDTEMADNSAAVLTLSELARDRDQLDVEIAEKRLRLYDIQGGSAVESVIETRPK